MTFRWSYYYHSSWYLASTNRSSCYICSGHLWICLFCPTGFCYRLYQCLSKPYGYGWRACWKGQGSPCRSQYWSGCGYPRTDFLFLPRFRDILDEAIWLRFLIRQGLLLWIWPSVCSYLIVKGLLRIDTLDEHLSCQGKKWGILPALLFRIVLRFQIGKRMFGKN